jgi:alpha-glucosidase
MMGFKNMKSAVLRVSVSLTAICFVVCSLLIASPMPSTAAETVREISPPLRGFFDKAIDYQGIAIYANRVVDDRALLVAKAKLSNMLGRAPEIVVNLREAGCELHIIGSKQGTSDLPENRHWKGKIYEGTQTIDERTRGVGGRFASCGEENLLHLKGDRYSDRDICFHEFAHTIQAYGLDSELRKRILAQFERSKQAGLWTGSYALSNEREFWAELSMWYLGSRGDFGKITPPPMVGAKWLMQYDPSAYRLLDDIYGGRLKPVVSTTVTLSPIPASKESELRSDNSAEPVTIVFMNQTDKPKQLLWLDFDGVRKFYAVIPPFEEVTQQTFVTHPWVIADDGGRALMIFSGKGKMSKAVIEDQKQ